jgi:hypothetical protein
MNLSTYGLVFEKNLHKQLKMTKYPVYNQTEIMNVLGNHITAIDNMIVLDYGCLCIQHKYCRDNINIAQTNYFTQTVNTVSQLINKPCIGIYLSRDKYLGQDNNLIFANNQMNMNNFIAIYGNTEKELINNLTEYLYSIQVYMYDSDGDCIMLS